MVTRIPILDVRPQIEGGRFAVKAVVSEEFEVRARVFGEGQAIVGAAVTTSGPNGVDRATVAMRHEGNDHWRAVICGDEVGPWTFRITSWHDPLATWLRDAGIKITADTDVELTLQEGVELLRQLDPEPTNEMLIGITEASRTAAERLVDAMMLANGRALHEHVDTTEAYPFFVDRERALHGAWYEMFPRSEGAEVGVDGGIRSGTFATAAKRLDAIAAMGFDVVYLPPIHPIGRRGRKGRNNSLTALPGDPGSPWAIGAAEGGHDAVHPELGTIDDFDAFVIHAASLGLEVALDLALQCAPDHPWVTEHPEWFKSRSDGTIAFSENPPKKYEDIYPLTFDNDAGGLYLEVRRVITHWMDHGVRIFRVDNPHTKPLAFWEQLLTDIRATDPDVVFLSEAFTVPAMVHALAAVGFHQSYTYFTWREKPAEMVAYLEEIAHGSSDFMRPNFFVNTPDILPTYLQSGDRAMFVSRATLAAMASPSWGMYAGFELLEHQPDGPGSEEYLDSEKYEIKMRDWDSPNSLAPFITTLNDIRQRHPALHLLRNLQMVRTDESSTVCFTKVRGDDIVLVVVNVRPSLEVSVGVRLDSISLGLDPGATWRDELDGSVCTIDAVPMGPKNPARILVPE